MSQAILQETFGGQAGGSFNSFSQAFTNNVTAGSVIHAICSVSGSGGDFSSVQDTLGNIYHQIGVEVFTVQGNSNKFTHFYAVSPSGGACNVTVNYATALGYPGLWIREISGCDTTNPLCGHSELSAAAAAGTDTISSGSATISNTAAFISAWSQDGGITVVTNGGTGFVQDLNNTLFGSGTEHKVLSAAGTYTATFSCGTSSTGFDTVMAIFAASPLASPKPIRLSSNGQFFANTFVESGSQVNANVSLKLYSNGTVQILNMVEPGTSIMTKLYANGTFTTNTFSEI